MAKLADETLMLYADGLLDAPETERVQRLLAQDARLEARVEEFRATGQNLAGLFDEHVSAPVPARLKEALEAPKVRPMDQARAATNPQRAPVMAPISRRYAWAPAALGASLSLIAGLGLGWLFWGQGAANTGSGVGLVAVDGHRLVARGALQGALEQQPSGQGAGADERVTVQMTFQNEAGDYCREYQVTSTSSQRHAGLACRVGGAWIVAIHALLPPTAAALRQMVPAGEGAGEPVHAAVAAMISGDPIVGEAEKALLARGWSK